MLALSGFGKDLRVLLARENLVFAFRVRERLSALLVRGREVVALLVREGSACSPG